MSRVDSAESMTEGSKAIERAKSSLVFLLPILFAVITAVFRDEIRDTLSNIPFYAYGFLLVGLGVAALHYFLISIIFDIEDIKGDMERLKFDNRRIMRHIRPDGGERQAPNLRNTIMLIGTISGIIAGGSIGLLAGEIGFIIGILVGASLGLFVGRKLATSKGKILYSFSDSEGRLSYESEATDEGGFNLALIKSDSERIYIDGERDSFVETDTDIEEAIFAIKLPWEDDCTIRVMNIQSTQHRDRSMGSEILYYGTLRFSNPDSVQEAELEFDFREYPNGHYDLFEISTYGGLAICDIYEYQSEIEGELE